MLKIIILFFTLSIPSYVFAQENDSLDPEAVIEKKEAEAPKQNLSQKEAPADLEKKQASEESKDKDPVSKSEQEQKEDEEFVNQPDVRNFSALSIKKKSLIKKNKNNKKGQLLQSVKDTDVRWFRPEIEPFKEGDKHLISLAGLTRPISYFTVFKKSFMKVDKDGEEKINISKKDVRHIPGYVDKRGVFIFEVLLPKGRYKMTMGLTEGDLKKEERTVKRFTIEIEVTDKSVEFVGADSPQFNKPNYNYYAMGLGLNFSAIKKQSSVPLELRYSSLKMPSVRLGYSKGFKDNLWQLDTSFLVAPGGTEDGTRVQVQDETYNWMQLHINGIYRKPSWNKKWKEYKLQWGLRSGLQYHLIPFLETVDNTSNKQKITMKSFQTLDFGGNLELITKSPFYYTAYMSFSVPGLANSDLDISSPFTFYGSLGAEYQKDEKWSYGLFWYGQWLFLSFSENDAFIGANAEGDFDILFSNLEFRLMYKF